MAKTEAGSGEEFKTEEICLAAVREKGRALEYVPMAFRTEEICLAAVRQDGGALGYVPESLKDKEICLAAVMQNGRALQYVPEKFKTEEICLAAVKQWWGSLQYVPEASKTKKICFAAVENHWLAFNHVPGEFKGKEIYLAAIKNNSSVLPDVPKDIILNEKFLLNLKLIFKNKIQFTILEDSKLKITFSTGLLKLRREVDTENSKISKKFVEESLQDSSKYSFEYTNKDGIKNKYITDIKYSFALSPTGIEGADEIYDALNFTGILKFLDLKDVINVSMCDKFLRSSIKNKLVVPKFKPNCMTIETRSFDQGKCKVQETSEIKIDFISHIINSNEELDHNDGTAFSIVGLPDADVIG